MLYTFLMKNTVIVVWEAQPPLVKLICIYIMLKEVLGLQIFACLHILTAHTEDDKEAFTCGVKTAARKKVKIFILPCFFISPLCIKTFMVISWQLLSFLRVCVSNVYHFTITTILQHTLWTVPTHNKTFKLWRFSFFILPFLRWHVLHNRNFHSAFIQLILLYHAPLKGFPSTFPIPHSWYKISFSSWISKKLRILNWMYIHVSVCKMIFFACLLALVYF